MAGWFFNLAFFHASTLPFSFSASGGKGVHGI
jgi:hypothetical protein